MSDQQKVPMTKAHKKDESLPPIPDERSGFLPIETNWFDRLFISVVIWIALSLFWFRFVEPAGISIWVSNAISLALAYIIIRRG
ncbi:DUF2160 family membrane protein [Grimontia sp. NTOU-MAR1]|uniref:DUF2160 family membrane protein n=1 Tax=Grimontia sp. NTOU-MAR1 TaxID=3111011 RepID=UPI002DBDE670|nr:DUF2160 family membrane protein [Grimontia sp. NTOU-MAR1]WRV99039.1 DUF2160 family membrane protein [Grimontia sp. NTOU-MAR1]